MESSREFVSAAAALKAKQMLALKERLRLRAQATRSPAPSPLDTSLDAHLTPAQAAQPHENTSHEEDAPLSSFGAWQREQVAPQEPLPPLKAPEHARSKLETNTSTSNQEKQSLQPSPNAEQQAEQKTASSREQRAQLLAARRALHHTSTPTLPSTGGNTLGQPPAPANRPFDPAVRPPLAGTPTRSEDATKTARMSLLDRLGALSPSEEPTRSTAPSSGVPESESLLSITRQALAALSANTPEAQTRKTGTDSPT